MKTLIISTIAAAALFISACNTNSASETKSIDTSSAPLAHVTYTCPMHPEVISDKPGKCPKCNMNLVEKGKENAEDHSGHQH